MSMGLRIGGAGYIGSKRPPDWQMNLFVLFVMLPLMLAFVAVGWTLLLRRAIWRCVQRRPARRA